MSFQPLTPHFGQELGPSITEDPKVAFPVKVFRLLGPNNVREHAPGLQEASGQFKEEQEAVPHKDLIVMKKAPGKSLSYVIGAECLRDLAGRAAKPISCTSSGKLASAWRIFTGLQRYFPDDSWHFCRNACKVHRQRLSSGGMVAGSAMMPESKTYCGMRTCSDLHLPRQRHRLQNFHYKP